jgi:hypothetical protein
MDHDWILTEYFIKEVSEVQFFEYLELPQNHNLSYVLLEGCYIRSELVTIELKSIK